MSRTTTVGNTMLHSDQDAWHAPQGSHRAGDSDEIRVLAREIEAMQRQQGDSMAQIMARLRALEESAARRQQTQVPGSEEAWDAASAEALMQACEQHALSSSPTSQQKPALGAPQDWIGHRFNDVTDRIKRTLTDLKPGTTMALLEERLDQFQRHIALALEDVVRRSDVEGLRLIEAHVTDLGDKLLNLERQVARLDGIEADVRNVIDQVSDERISALLDGGSRFTADLEAIAVRAAEEVHTRLSHAHEPDARMHDELRTLIEDSIRERRAADAQAASLVSGLSGKVSAQDDRYDEIKSLLLQTSQDQRQSEQTTISMLDTLQQALVQVLDRIDVLEQQHKQPAPAVADVVAPAIAAFAAARAPVEAPAMPDFHDVAPLPRAFASVAPAPASPDADSFKPHMQYAGAEADDPAPQFDRMRRDFIADARRAKLKAAANRAEAVSASPKDTLPPLRKTAAVAAALTQAARAPAGGSGRLFGASPKLLAAALAVVVAINGGILLINRKSSPPAAPAVTVQPSLTPSDAPHESEAAPEAENAPVGPRSHLDQDGADFGDTPPATGNAFTTYGLQDDVLDPPSVEALGDGKAVTVPSGTTIARPPGSLPDDVVASVYQEQVLASLSGKLGAVAATKSTKQLLPEAAGRVETAYNADPEMDPVSPTEERVSGLDLPPATVGPLSLRIAAANGDASAEFEVAARLAEGKGTEQNYAEALRWYQRAAGKGFAQAQYRLGTFYERGFGVAQDAERAKVWYTRAAEQGNVKSMHNLAVLAAGGESGNPNYGGALKWFQKAAEFGLADSQYNLGVLLENGLGTKADTIQAYKWYALAAKSGDADALQRRDALKASFSADHLKAADRLVADFKARQAAPLANDARAAGEDWKKRANNDKAR